MAECSRGQRMREERIIFRSSTQCSNRDQQNRGNMRHTLNIAVIGSVKGICKKDIPELLTEIRSAFKESKLREGSRKVNFNLCNGALMRKDLARKLLR
jgi:hypothetical protein